MRPLACACEAFSDVLYVSRYLALGVLSTVLNFGVFWLLYEVFEVWYLAATAIAFVVRFGVKFLLVRSWLFGEAVPGSVARQGAWFTLLEAVFLAASLFLMTFLVETVRFPPLWALVVTSFVTSMSALVITRYVFRPVTVRPE